MPAIELDWYRTGTVAGWIVAIQVVILAILGAGQVNASVNGARASGILDFHRVSPLTSTELTLGLLLRRADPRVRPVRRHAPVHRALHGLRHPQLPRVRPAHDRRAHDVLDDPRLMVLLNGLISKAKTPSGGIVGVIVFLIFFFGLIFAGAQFSVNVVESEHRLDFFGFSLPWLPVVLALPVAGPVLPAAGRDPQDGVATAPSALASRRRSWPWLTFATLVLGGIWRKEGIRDLSTSSALYLLAVPAILLTMMITPVAGRVHQGPPSRPEAGQDAAALVGRPLGELAQRGDPGGGSCWRPGRVAGYRGRGRRQPVLGQPHRTDLTRWPWPPRS